MDKDTYHLMSMALAILVYSNDGYGLSFTLEKSRLGYLLNDFGVPITGQQAVVMNMKICGGLIINLTERPGGKETASIELHIGEDKKNVIYYKPRSTKNKKTIFEKTEKVWQCMEPTVLWVRWLPGLVDAGTGLEIGEHTVMTASYGDPVMVNYLTVYMFKDSNVHVTIHENPLLQVYPETVYIDETEPSGTKIYTLPSGVRFSPPGIHGHFNVTNKTITLLHRLDYERRKLHIITLQVTNGLTNRNISVYIVLRNVYDEKPVITVFYDACAIIEELPVDTDIGRVFMATDSDIGDKLIYELIGKDASYLSIDADNGRVKVKKGIDRDGPGGIVVLDRLEVKVTDKGNNSASMPLVLEIIDLNDHPPRFLSSLFTINVHPLSEATAIAKLVCYDGDFTEINNRTCHLTIQQGNDDNVFNIEDFQLVANLDALKQHSEKIHMLLVQASDLTDEHQENTSTVVMVKVTPSNGSNGVQQDVENLHPPEWVYPIKAGQTKMRTVIIPEDTKPGTVVLSVHAVDKDKGEAGRVTYSFKPKLSRGKRINFSGMYFKMDADTGNLSVAFPLDRDKKTGGAIKFYVYIMASDGGSPPKMISAYVNLLLKNVNDNPPSFDKTLYKTSVNCDHDQQKEILIFSVTDNDNDIVKQVSVDLDNHYKYHSHKFARKWKLIRRKRTDKDGEALEVVRLSASDGRLTSTTTVLVHLLPCVVNDTLSTRSSTMSIQSTTILTSTTEATTEAEKTSVIPDVTPLATDPTWSTKNQRITSSKSSTSDMATGVDPLRVLPSGSTQGQASGIGTIKGCTCADYKKNPEEESTTLLPSSSTSASQTTMLVQTTTATEQSPSTTTSNAGITEETTRRQRVTARVKSVSVRGSDIIVTSKGGSDITMTSHRARGTCDAPVSIYVVSGVAVVALLGWMAAGVLARKYMTVRRQVEPHIPLPEQVEKNNVVEVKE